MGSLLLSLAILKTSNLSSVKAFEFVKRLCNGKPVLESLFNSLVKRTLFKHFCAGQVEQEVEQTIAQLKQREILSILDYAAEKEISSAKQGEFSAFSRKNHQHIAQSIRIAANCGDAAVAVKVSSLIPHWILAQKTLGEEWWNQLESVVQLAAASKVDLFFDAEQHSIQPAIDEIALHFMQKYPRIVFNTYQLYLKDSLAKLQAHYSFIQAKGLPFQAKLVRGAYLHQEPKEIICASAEETHRNYNAAVEWLLERIHADNPHSRCMLATHNKYSIEQAISISTKLHIQRQVSYSQLLGMCNYLTEQLAEQKLLVYKYVPYGPVEEVMPYLVRRAIENSSLLTASKVEEEKFLMKKIWAQVKGKFWRIKEC